MTDISDKPKDQLEDDAFGYAEFASNLAVGVVRMDAQKGFVIGIHGEWGSGKTTLLNFTEQFLKNSNEKQVTIVHFNPWWFSGYRDLTLRFFEMFLIELSKWGWRWRNIRDSVASFGDAVSSIPVNGAGFVGSALKHVSKSDKDLNSQKEEICKLLRDSGKTVVVMIDDVDRLSKDEAVELFRLIKSVADFPNVIYIVAFDRDVVAKMLADSVGIDGHDYLEKIIQVSLNLPLIDKQSMDTYFNKKLENVLGQTYAVLNSQIYWHNIYVEGLRDIIRTPRTVNRLINNLALSYPMVSAEVNPADFIAIEALHTTYPEIYDRIKENLEVFTGIISPSKTSVEKDLIKNIVDRTVEVADEAHQESVRRMLIRMFPKLEAVYGNMHYPSEYLAGWYRESRICHPERGEYYFRLVFPSSYFSKKELDEILGSINDPPLFGSLMIKLATSPGQDRLTKLVPFIKFLLNYDLTGASAPQVIQALFTVGDKLYNKCDETYDTTGFGSTRHRIITIIMRALEAIDPNDRTTVLKKAIEDGEALSTMVETMHTLGYQHDMYGQMRQEQGGTILDKKTIIDIELILIPKIEAASIDGTLVEAPALSIVLSYWEEALSNKQIVSDWLAKVCEDDTSLLKLLEGQLSVGKSQVLTDSVSTLSYRFPVPWIEQYTDVDTLRDNVNRIRQKTSLTQSQLMAITVFDDSYNHWKGKKGDLANLAGAELDSDDS